jgi:hypothetical protein
MGGGVGEAMLIGAITGGATSAATGGDPLKGALLGATTGGVGAGVAGATTGATAGTTAGATERQRGLRLRLERLRLVVRLVLSLLTQQVQNFLQAKGLVRALHQQM